MASKKPKLIFVIDESLLKQVDDFRFDHRFPSRAAAVIWLLRFALKQNPKPKRK